MFFLNPALCKEIGSKQEELTKPPTTLISDRETKQRGKSLAHNRGNT